MVKSAPGDLTAAAATATLQLVERSPSCVADSTDASTLYKIAAHFASAVDGPTRKVSAKICGALAPRLAPEAAVTELSRLLATAGVGGSKAGGETHGRFEDQDGALRAAGYVAAAGGGGPGSSRTLTFPGDKIREALDVFVAVAGKFIFIYVWAIRMTTCFVHRV